MKTSIILASILAMNYANTHWTQDRASMAALSSIAFITLCVTLTVSAYRAISK